LSVLSISRQLVLAAFLCELCGVLCAFCVKGFTAKDAKKSAQRTRRKTFKHMEVTVYSAFWCPDCRLAKRFLQGHNIPFKEVDIESTPGAADEVVARTGKRAIPQFVIDGEWVQPYRAGEGFLYEEMSERLGIKET
jgi:mycoredoxin